VAASVAAANYVMSLFDRPELRSLALQNYNEVVKGREDNPDVRPFKLRFEQLRGGARRLRGARTRAGTGPNAGDRVNRPVSAARGVTAR